MATFTELREAVTAVLASELPTDAPDGVHLYAQGVEDANLPAIVVSAIEADFPLQAGMANDIWQFDLIVMVSFGDAVVAQKQLDQFLSAQGPRSLRQILMRHPKLDRPDVMNAFISGFSDYGARYTMASVDNIGCRVRLTVQTTGPAWG